MSAALALSTTPLHWRPTTLIHSLHPRLFREAVTAVLLLSCRERPRSSSPLARLPFELLCGVIEELVPEPPSNIQCVFAMCRVAQTPAVCPECGVHTSVGDEKCSGCIRWNETGKESFEYQVASHPGDFRTISVPYDGIDRTTVMKSFSMDKVFPPEATQADVFDAVAPIVQRVVLGGRVSVLAYGQTGSGKTRTMRCSPHGGRSTEDEGLMYRCGAMLAHQVALMQAEGWPVTLTGSLLGIYNELLQDYLRPGAHSDFSIRCNPDGRLSVTNLSEEVLSSAEDVRSLIDRGYANLFTLASGIASRTQILLMLKVEGSYGTQQICGRLNLVKCAGSERVSKANVTTGLLQEAQRISMSLSSLGAVVEALGSGAKHIPYRNSKLTYLLKETFEEGGTAVILGCLSSHPANRNETISTIRFVNRVGKLPPREPKE